MVAFVVISLILIAAILINAHLADLEDKRRTEALRLFVAAITAYHKTLDSGSACLDGRDTVLHNLNVDRLLAELEGLDRRLSELDTSMKSSDLRQPPIDPMLTPSAWMRGHAPKRMTYSERRHRRWRGT